MSPDWALLDKLVYSVVSSLLQLANHYLRFGKSIIDTVLEFSAAIVEKIQSSGCMWIQFSPPPAVRITMSFGLIFLAAEILSQFAPAFHGFYRALMSTTYRWAPQPPVRSTVHRSAQLSRYRHCPARRNRPRGHPIRHDLACSLRFSQPPLERVLICFVTKVQWTVLTQALIPLDLDVQFGEAAAANSMSQKLSAVCSVALSAFDENLFTRLKLLLSDQTPLADNLVQEAALKSIAILVRK